MEGSRKQTGRYEIRSLLYDGFKGRKIVGVVGMFENSLVGLARKVIN